MTEVENKAGSESEPPFKRASDNEINCKWCGSTEYHKKGTRNTLSGIKQIYHCRECGCNFSSGAKETEKTADKKITYPQDWPAYNAAQTTEGILFRKILYELCEPLPTRKPCFGRPSFSFPALVFSLCLKTYDGLSGRRLISELTMAEQQDYISQVPHFNSLYNGLNSSQLTPYLQDLVKTSSLPLKEVETDFAVDSTGFSTSMFSRWLDMRDRESKGERRLRLWVKCHAMCGVKTNIITSVEVTTARESDIKQLAPLIEKTDDGFKIKELSADKAYSGRNALRAVVEAGGLPFIPFRKGTNPKPKGDKVWRDMYTYFVLHRQEFMDCYHKRSNVESCFSMIKRKFGHRLRSKRFIGQTNELLTKIICHNICVLIQEMHELGIELNFGLKQKAMAVS